MQKDAGYLRNHWFHCPSEHIEESSLSIVKCVYQQAGKEGNDVIMCLFAYVSVLTQLNKEPFTVHKHDDDWHIKKQQNLPTSIQVMTTHL